MTDYADGVRELGRILKSVGSWFDNNIITGLVHLLKALGYIMIQILEFFIEIIKWLINHI